MIILDTNVLSELVRPLPNPSVVAWIERRALSSLFTTALTEAEMRYGIELLPPGGRRDRLEQAVVGILADGFAERILTFDSAAAEAYATIVAARRASGRPISQLDGLIAGIAASRAATIATRNTRDFEGCGITLMNPWLPE